MKAVNTSETSVRFCESTQCNFPKDSIFTFVAMGTSNITCFCTVRGGEGCLLQENLVFRGMHRMPWHYLRNVHNGWVTVPISSSGIIRERLLWIPDNGPPHGNKTRTKKRILLSYRAAGTAHRARARCRCRKQHVPDVNCRSVPWRTHVRISRVTATQQWRATGWFTSKLPG
jgi:hypothetical protein